MMASGRVPDYLGVGVIADRPASLDLADDTLGLWWATDTETLSAWDGSAWADIVSGGGGSVASVAAGTGIDVDATDPANPEVSLDAATIASLALADSATQPGDLGTAASTDATDYATAAQGALADSAVQPGDLATVATSGDAADVAIADAGGYFTGTSVEAALQELGASAGGGADRSTVTALSISSGVVNIDCSLGDFFTLSLTANVTSITFSNLPASGKGASLAIQIKQDATGSRTVALPSSFKATGNSDTAVQSAANAYTLLTITTFDQGTRWAYAMQEVAA